MFTYQQGWCLLQQQKHNIVCVQGFVDRLAVIANEGSTEAEPEGRFLKALKEATEDKNRIVFVGHSLGCVLASSGIVPNYCACHISAASRSCKSMSVAVKPVGSVV